MTRPARTASVPRVKRAPHENVATVLVAPAAHTALELALAERDLWMWPVATAPVYVDGARMAFQIRRRLLQAQRGAWDCAADWTPVWVSFGCSWRHGDEPLPWAAHQALWETLASFADDVRYRPRLGGVPVLTVPAEQAADRRLSG